MDQSTTAIYCVVIQTAAGPLALIRNDNTYQLPVVHLPDSSWLPANAAKINGDLMDEFGLNCTLLRWLEQCDDHNLVVMEWHPGSALPEIDVEWVDPGNNALPLPPVQLQMIRKWRESSSDGLAPWEKPGWMKNTVLSIIRVFDGQHHPQVSSLAQFKAAWGLSTLLLIETSESEYYFKAGTRQGVDEWRVTKLLHQSFPQYIPEPLLVDEQNGWMITRHVEKRNFSSLDHDSMGKAFRAYAEIQLGCEDFSDSDKMAGLMVRDAAWFRRHLEAVFSDASCPAAFSGPKSRLNHQQLATLRETWLRQIDKLEASSLPMGFNQEDLHLDNILNTQNGPVFIDWADCARSHPFFSMHRTLRLWGGDDPDRAELEKQIVTQAYLGAFIHLATADQLSNEFDLTERLSLLYQALRCLEISREQMPDSPWGEHCFNRAARYMGDAMTGINGSDA
jgi:hypothetical protein